MIPILHKSYMNIDLLWELLQGHKFEGMLNLKNFCEQRITARNTIN